MLGLVAERELTEYTHIAAPASAEHMTLEPSANHTTTSNFPTSLVTQHNQQDKVNEIYSATRNIRVQQKIMVYYLSTLVVLITVADTVL